MERKESNPGMLDLMIQPAFTVENGIIEKVNEAGSKYFLEAGMQIADLLLTGKTEYRELQDGCLYLTLSVAGIPCGASVRKINGTDVFTLEQDADNAQLQAMALAAQELRMPLANVMTVADRLFPVTEETEDPAVKDQVAQINRGLFQMLRIISNMSDAYRYEQQTEPKMAVTNISSVIEEIFQHATQQLHYGGKQLVFENDAKTVLGLADQEKLERAIYNIISNAVKFSSNSSPIHARLSRRNHMLYLTVTDEGSKQQIQGNIHTRFRRQPGLEDSRFGIGLGMVMIRAAAAAHGGTVLISQSEEGGTKLTMSIAINQNTESMVRNYDLRVDYGGERDHALIELADVLPFSAYEAGKIN